MCDCRGLDGRLDTKISQIDKSHISMSYSSYDIKCYIMTNDPYDIEIWSILVSKQPGGPQQSSLFIQSLLKNDLS
jgi:hypothetical protein